MERNVVVCSRFALTKKIGAGSFGEIHSAEDISTHQIVAVKLEPAKTTSPQLEYESRLYHVFCTGINIAKIYFYGNDSRWNVMAIELLGKSLENLLFERKSPFTLKSVLMLAEQMINAVQYIHSRHFIHRDIKPDNFVIGRENDSNKLYLIDFGLAKRFRDPKTLQHIEFQANKNLTGTARYASLNAMLGAEQSRRDDLESLGFVMIYLLKGKLPWQGLQARDQKQKMRKVLQAKKNTSIEELCEGLPPQFAEYMNKVRKLKFAEDPDYTDYKNIFRDLMVQSGYSYDYNYDWIEPRPKFKIHPPPESAETIARKYFNQIKENRSPQPYVFPKTARFEHRLRTALPSSPKFRNLNVSPRVSKPHLPPRFYQTKKILQFTERYD